VQRRKGQWNEALANFRRAVELDPRSQNNRFNLGETYWLLHDQTHAVQAFDEAIGLAPDWSQPYVGKAQALLGSGADVEQARQVLRAAAERVGIPDLAEATSGGWAGGGFATMPTFLLTQDPGYRQPLEDLTLASFTDTVSYYQLKAELYRNERRPDLERPYLDSCRTVLEAMVRARPEEAPYHGRLGMIYAYLGRTTDALREGEAAVRALPVSREAYRGSALVALLARIEAVTGRPDSAVARLEYLLSIPSAVSRPLLKVDPAWDPLRDNARFRRLVEE
jgi:tetratricopeptide (TPR) repeat protein